MAQDHELTIALLSAAFYSFITFQSLHGRSRRRMAVTLHFSHTFLLPLLFAFQMPFDSLQLTAVPALLSAAAIDLEDGWIPDSCWLGIVSIALASPTRHLLYATAVFLVLGTASHFSMIGFGDTKLITAFAFLEGNLVFPAVAAASLAGILLLTILKEKDKPFAFAPCLCFGFLLIFCLNTR